jgi:hypothetical protein
MINTHSNNSNNAEGMNCEFTEHELKQFMLQICGNDMERAEEGVNTILETCAPYEVTD